MLGARIEIPLADESVFLGLGTAAAGGRFGVEVRASLVEALIADAERALALGAETITFLGTEPLRRAADASRVVRAIEAAGWPLHVLSHEEEALLTLIGATGGRPVTEPLAVVDIGGGSSDIAIVEPGGPPVATGVRAGAGVLSREHVAHDPPLRDELDEVRRAAAGLLLTATAGVGKVRSVVAVGGTSTNVVKVLAAADPAQPDPWLTRERLEAALDLLLAAPADETALRYVLNPTRARLLPAGIAILEATLDRFGVDRLRADDAGIREGTILSVAREGAFWRDALPTLAGGWADEPAGEVAGADEPVSHGSEAVDARR
ncbi:MAG TPA: hypothetical protein VEY67_10590 [Candidatus Dormibacteraeota bacterium]|nr:hypothetical protein [Candidatus Dormibacteraeota bacterium]